MRKRSPTRTLAFLAAAVLFASAREGSAQLKGHYIPGFTGLENGTQAPPSISLGVPVYVYPTDSIKDDHGNTLASPSVTASFFGLGVVWVTNAKILGANLGGSVTPVAFIKSRIESASLDVPGSYAFTDLALQPLQLGWHTPRADYTVGWTVFFPTGKWELGGSDNAGLGQWSYDFQAGTTVRLDDKHAWSTSLLTTYEIHSHKKHTDLTTGDILTLEGGTGKSFYEKVEGSPIPQITTFGLVYYGQFKVGADKGAGPLADILLAGRKDRVFGVGLEGSMYLPKSRLLLGLRIVPEFAARNRTQGTTFLLTLGYQAKMFLKSAEHE